jgi:ribonuclease I
MANEYRICWLLLIATLVWMRVSAAEVELASLPATTRPLREAYTLELLWWPKYCHDNPRLKYCAGACFQGFVLGAYIPLTANQRARTCKTPVARFIPDGKLLKVMPDEQLLRPQWELYGACSGLSQTQYFESLRRIFGSIHVPERFILPPDHFSITTEEARDVFLQINHRLQPDAVDVFCSQGMLSKVEIHSRFPGMHSAESCHLPTVKVIARMPLAE